MSEAYQCDRCYEVCEGTPDYGIMAGELVSYIDGMGKRFSDDELRHDLCPECYREYEDWWSLGG